MQPLRGAQSIPVFVLESKDAISLIKKGEPEGLVFDQEAIDEILFLTQRHPYFIQLLCQEIFNRYAPEYGDEIITVTRQMVTELVPGALVSHGSSFKWIWEGLPPAERIVFSAIAERTARGRLISENEIGQILKEAGIRMMVKELHLAPSTLVDWKMLEEINGQYRFYFEIMREWVEINRELRQVKDELEKINPAADDLYRAAHTFYYFENNTALALEQLTQALKSNPNHLKARLLIGTIYHEKGDFENAIGQFKDARRLDEKDALIELLSTMLDFGRYLENEGKIDNAEKIYDEILSDVHENDEIAIERKTNIIIRRAESAYEFGEVEQAERFVNNVLYYQATNKEAISLATNIKLVRSKVRAARQAYDMDHFDSAQKFLDDALTFQPSNKEAIELSFRIRELQSNLESARESFIAGDNKRAEHALRQMISVRPSIREANDLLAKIEIIQDLIDEATYSVRKTGNLDGAQDALERVIAIQPANEEARNLTKEIKTLKNNYERAQQAFATGNTLETESMLADVLFHQPSSNEARELKRNVEKVKESYSLALKAFNVGNNSNAQELLEDIFTIQPSNKEASELDIRLHQSKNKLPRPMMLLSVDQIPLQFAILTMY